MGTGSLNWTTGLSHLIDTVYYDYHGLDIPCRALGLLNHITWKLNGVEVDKTLCTQSSVCHCDTCLYLYQYSVIHTASHNDKLHNCELLTLVDVHAESVY